MDILRFDFFKLLVANVQMIVSDMVVNYCIRFFGFYIIFSNRKGKKFANKPTTTNKKNENENYHKNKYKQFK